MSGLATKQQSLKIFEKLKTKPANKVSNGPAVALQLSACALYHKTLYLFSFSPDLLRLRSKEPNLDLCSLRNLPVPGLLLQPPKPWRPHLLCAINEPRPYVTANRVPFASRANQARRVAMGPTPIDEGWWQ